MEFLEVLAERESDKVESMLAMIPKGEFRSWYGNPVTQYLLASLKADLLGMVNQWQSGIHLKDTVEETALENVKLVAKSQATEEIVTFIEEMRYSGEENSDDPSGSQDSN